MPKGIPNKKAPAPATKKPPGRPPVKPLPPKPEPAKKVYDRYLLVETNPAGGIKGKAVPSFPGGPIEESWEQRYEQGPIVYVVHVTSRLVLSSSQRELIVQKINEAILPPAVPVST